MESSNIEAMIKVGGPTLVNLMRVATRDSALAKTAFSAKELEFLTDAAARARDFHDKLTPKQETWAQSILRKPAALLLISSLLAADETSPSADAPSEPAQTPTPPSYSYSADPEWGRF